MSNKNSRFDIHFLSQLEVQLGTLRGHYISNETKLEKLIKILKQL